MSNYDMEKKIEKAYKGLAPDIKQSIISDVEAQKGIKVMTNTESKKPNKKNFKGILAIAACLVLVLGSFGVVTANANKVKTTVVLDVNPSIEIKLNKNEKVVEVKALNDDAKAVVGDMDFKGSSLEVTVNALIGSLVRNGYISADANSILVSVSGDNTESDKEIENKLMEEINQVLSSSNVSGSILAQVVVDDPELKQLAIQFNISEGKAALINEILSEETAHKFEDFVNLTINELNAIAQCKGQTFENIKKLGECSIGKYIDLEKAKQIALNDCGLSLFIGNLFGLETELDWEDGQMVYEIKYKIGDKEYEYEINATTGVIISKDVNGETQTSIKDLFKIGEAYAKEIALKHAGLLDKHLSNVEIELEKEDGLFVYEISFEYGGQEYEYKINVVTGDIVTVEIEKD